MTDLAELPRSRRPNGPAAPQALAEVYEAASLCNKCSLCQAVCPTYVVNPVEWETARGRVSLVRDVIEGRLALADIADGPLSTCLTCNNCVAACAPAVPTADIIDAARAELGAEQGHPWRQTLAFRALLPNPRVFRLLHRGARAAQLTGVLPLARRSGLTRWMGITGDLADHVGPLPGRTAYHRARKLPPPDGPVRGRLAYLVCCYENLAAPGAAEAAMRLLLADGWGLVIPELGCSGLPARTAGDRDSVRDLAIRTVERLAELDVDGFVGDSASCTGHLQRYGEILGADPFLAAASRSIAARTSQISTFLDREGMTAALGPVRWTVAYDEPCSLPLDGQVRKAPYRLLDAIPGLRRVQLQEAAMCCGGPGTYFRDQPERSAAILARKFEHVVASGAEVLVTENVSCLLQLRVGARLYAPQVRVLHLAEVVLASVEAARRREAILYE